MKNNQLAQMLLFVLLLSALFSAWLSLRYTSSLRKLQRLQPQVMQVNGYNGIFQSLYNDSQEYAKTHPDLVPIMQAALGQANQGAAPKAPVK